MLHLKIKMSQVMERRQEQLHNEILLSSTYDFVSKLMVFSLHIPAVHIKTTSWNRNTEINATNTNLLYYVQIHKDRV